MIEWGVLCVGRTYHEHGYFNETLSTPRFPRPEELHESVVILECLGARTSVSVQAKVRYRNADGSGTWINQNRNARIYGGMALARWFQQNVAVEEEVRIEAVDPLKRYRLSSSAARRRSVRSAPDGEVRS